VFPVDITLDLSTTWPAMITTNDDLGRSTVTLLLSEYNTIIMIISRRLKSEAATVWGGTLRSGNLIDAKIVLTFNLHPCVWLLIKYIRFVSFPWSRCPPLRRRLHRSTVYKPVMAGESAAAHEVISMGTVINHE